MPVALAAYEHWLAWDESAPLPQVLAEAFDTMAGAWAERPAQHPYPSTRRSEPAQPPGPVFITLPGIPPPTTPDSTPSR